MGRALVSRIRPLAVTLAALAALEGCGDQSSVATAPAVDAAAAAGCRDGDPSVQRHGSPCLCCHSDEFGVAGSVAASNVARVVVVDARGEVADMAPNVFGNFFRHYPLAPPLAITAYTDDRRAVTMQSLAPHGDCNACHAAGGAAPPIHAP